MNFVLFDIGNTRLKWAIANTSEILQAEALTHDQVSNLAAPPAPIRSALKADSVRAVISCVGSPATLSRVTESWLAPLAEAQILRVGVEKSFGQLTNGYQNREQLGVDRWVACFGAREIVPRGDVIIVDAGTAVTVDWLGKDNEFKGGAILPSAKLMHDALVGQTVGIQSKLSEQVRIVGKSTSECVNSGVTYGLVGAVENVVSKMKEEIGNPTNIVVCGGAADLLKRCSFAEQAVFEANLILTGLRVMGQISQPFAARDSE